MWVQMFSSAWDDIEFMRGQWHLQGVDERGPQGMDGGQQLRSLRRHWLNRGLAPHEALDAMLLDFQHRRGVLQRLQRASGHIHRQQEHLHSVTPAHHPYAVLHVSM